MCRTFLREVSITKFLFCNIVQYLLKLFIGFPFLCYFWNWPLTFLKRIVNNGCHQFTFYQFSILVANMDWTNSKGSYKSSAYFLWLIYIFFYRATNLHWKFSGNFSIQPHLHLSFVFSKHSSLPCLFSQFPALTFILDKHNLTSTLLFPLSLPNTDSFLVCSLKSLL